MDLPTVKDLKEAGKDAKEDKDGAGDQGQGAVAFDFEEGQSYHEVKE
jgi:hypothetical protein